MAGKTLEPRVIHFWAGSGGGVWSFIRELALRQSSTRRVSLAWVVRGMPRKAILDQIPEIFEQSIIVRRPPLPAVYYAARNDVARLLRGLGVVLETDNAALHFHAGPATYWIWNADWNRIGPRSIVTFNGSRGNFHDTSITGFPRRILHVYGVRRMIQAGASLVAVSKQSAYDCAKLYKVSTDNFNVIYNGTSDAATPGPGDCGPIGRRRFHVGFIGTVQPIKGWRRVVAAVEILRRDGYNVECSVVGDGPQLDDLQSIAKEKGSWLNAPGHVPNAGSTVLSTFDVLVLPSEFEGLPLVLVEALAAGVPAICSDVGGNREAIRDGMEGFVLRHNSASEIASQLRRMIDDPSLLQRLARNCRARYLSCFTADVACAEYDKLYQQSETGSLTAHESGGTAVIKSH